MAQTTTVTSKQFTLNLPDIYKGLIMAIITPAIMVMITSLDAGSLIFNWHNIAVMSLSGGLGYILKNFLTPSAVVIKDVSNDTLDAVKEGKAKVTVTPK